MGREVRRVKEGFEWPLNKVWDGYLNPHYKECPKCRAGYSKAYDIVAKHLNGLMWDQEVKNNKDVSEITKFLCGRECRDSILGHDSSDAWMAVKKLGELAGLQKEWSTCKHCAGDSIDPNIKEKYEAWEETQPPEGEWYQVWETTSEGSPNSPAFETPEELAEWLESNNASSFGRHTCSYDQWLDFIRGPGWAPSMIMDSTGLHSGVCASTKNRQ